VLARHQRSWQAATDILSRGQVTAAAVRCLGQLLFALGYIGSLYLVFHQVAQGSATIGDFVLVLALAVQVSTQISTATALLAALQQAGQTAERLDWLAAQRAAAPAPPATVTGAEPVGDPGTTLDAVSFTYPGRDRPALQDVSVHIPAGAVVAVVGENGAGKSTLVKLLCGLYTPTAGRITFTAATTGAGGGAAVDDRENSRFGCLFQDFARIELSLLESVGLGDVARLAEPPVTRALGAANAGGLVAELPAGLASIVGQRYESGTELSGGQWQKVALARALMREHVDLLMLDEPAAALDALAEHELFERFAAAARGGSARDGTTTIVVSHRLSTVRLADLILVVHNGRLSQHGTHDELMSAAGTYADLFTLQARAYA
jgi:ATP-binding cassette subfamily B protein